MQAQRGSRSRSTTSRKRGPKKAARARGRTRAVKRWIRAVPEQVFYGLASALVLAIAASAFHVVFGGDGSRTGPDGQIPSAESRRVPGRDDRGAGGTRRTPSGSETTTGSSNPIPDLRGIDLVVDNTLNGKPRIDVTLHNVGTGRSIVKRAQVRIRRFLAIDRCYTQGDLPIGQTYDFRLPTRPSGGEVIVAPISRQLPVDGADKFALSLGTDGTRPGEMPADARVRLYQLDVSVLHDDQGTRPLQLGTVLVSLPSIPISSQYYSTSTIEASWNTVKDFPADRVLPCWRANNKNLSAFLSLTGERSPQLAAVGSDARRATAGFAPEAAGAGSVERGPAHPAKRPPCPPTEGSRLSGPTTGPNVPSAICRDSAGQVPEGEDGVRKLEDPIAGSQRQAKVPT
jgi:hypothetical protein